MNKLFKGMMLCAFTLVSAACVSSEAEESAGAGESTRTEEGEWVSLARSGGEGIFVEKCGMCHRANGAGTGLLSRRYEGELALLENREDLQAVFVETVVRNGLGNMLPMSRGEVSDGQLAEIAAYLAGE